MVYLAGISKFLGLSSTDEQLGSLAIRDGAELPVNDLVDRSGEHHGFALVVPIRQSSWNMPVIHGYILERVAESLAELHKEGGAHLDNLRVYREQGTFWPQHLMGDLELSRFGSVDLDVP